MERITVRHVRAMFDRAVEAWVKLTPGATDMRPWVLQEGSATNGRAWRMFQLMDGGGHRDLLGSDGYLGWNAREAYDALHALARGWELAQDQCDLVATHAVQHARGQLLGNMVRGAQS